jgi:hypothetical protein
LLPTWLSTVFPQATIQRTVGVAIIFCLLALGVVVWWESVGKKSRFRRRGGNPPPGGPPEGKPPQATPPGQSFGPTQGNVGSQGQTGGRTTQINKYTVMPSRRPALLGIGPSAVVTGLRMIGNRVWGDADLINNQGRLEDPLIALNELHPDPPAPRLSRAERRKRWKEQHGPKT